MKGRPKVDIGIYLLNEEGNKILLGFNKIENRWKLPGGKLQFSDDFTDCAQRELYNKLNLKVKAERLEKFVSLNVLDRERNYHSIEVDFHLKLTINEEKFIKNSSKLDYEWWVWFEYNDILEVKHELCFGIEAFFKKFKITSFPQITYIFSKFT